MEFRKVLQVKPIYILYWSLGCFLIGILLAPVVLSSPPNDHTTYLTHDHAQPHGTIEVDPENQPMIKHAPLN